MLLTNGGLIHHEPVHLYGLGHNVLQLVRHGYVGLVLYGVTRLGLHGEHDSVGLFT